jgi:DNA-binding response OmpR family regulator
MFLAAELKEAGWEMLMAENAAHARFLFQELRPGAVLLDYMLGDDDGLKLGLEFQARAPGTKIVIMTGGGLSDEELAVCLDRNFPILFKPFLAHDVLNLIRGPYRRSFAAGASSNSSAGVTGSV